ncbi:MAG: mechanosensitive ion channel family protein [Phycisphaeraceae bacterium]
MNRRPFRTVLSLLLLCLLPVAALAADDGPSASDPPPAGEQPAAESRLENNPLREIMPDELVGAENELLNVEYWQWLGIVVIVLVGVTLDQVVRGLLRTATAVRIRKRGGEVDDAALKLTVRPFGLAAGGVVWLLLLPLLSLPQGAYLFLNGAVSVFVIFAGTWALWRLIDLVSKFFEAKAEKTQNKFDDILIPLLRKTARVLVVVVGILFAASALNLPIIPLLGSLGLGSLAFAFAAKDTVENFFGSVAVILDRPFEVGDWIVIEGGTEGTVEELGFRSTRIRTFYNSQITVPNATLVRATVDNYGRRKYRRWKTHVGVQYDTPPELLIAFTEGIRELVRSHPYTRKDYYQVWMHQWSASSMDVLLYVFFEVPDWSTELRERERMFIDIVRLADKLGVQFAFPTQTVHLFKEEHKPHETRHPTPGASTDKRSMVTGIRAARELIKQQAWRHNPPGAVSYSLDGVERLLDEAGNETLVDKEKKTEPTAETSRPNVQGEDEPPSPPTPG